MKTAILIAALSAMIATGASAQSTGSEHTAPGAGTSGGSGATTSGAGDLTNPGKGDATMGSAASLPNPPPMKSNGASAASKKHSKTHKAGSDAAHTSSSGNGDAKSNSAAAK